MCSLSDQPVSAGTGLLSKNTLGPGLTFDDFWQLGHKPILTKDGVYKKFGEDDHEKKSATAADEEKKKVPRRVIPNNEVDRFIEAFWPKSELGRDETRALINMFFEYARKKNNPGFLTKDKFKRFIFGTLDIYDPFICERMFIVFDSNNDGFINYQEWTHGMHAILVGSIHEQLKFYDTRNRGFLDKDDIDVWVKRSYFNLSPMTDVQRAEYFEDIHHLIMEKFVQNADNRITFRQYRTAVCNQPSLLELIGTVLPETEATWRLNDILFSRLYRSKYLMLFPRGDVPKDRLVRFDPSKLVDRYPATEACYPPNYVKGPDGKPALKIAVQPQADPKSGAVATGQADVKPKEEGQTEQKAKKGETRSRNK